MNRRSFLGLLGLAGPVAILSSAKADEPEIEALVMEHPDLPEPVVIGTHSVTRPIRLIIREELHKQYGLRPRHGLR